MRKRNDSIQKLQKKLINVREKGPKVHAKLKKEEITPIIASAKETFISQPCFLEIEAPFVVVGDIHGQFMDLLRIFDSIGYPPMKNYLFLGDYVDRGTQSLETLLLLLTYKILYPDKFHMLRGNHECRRISRSYGFFDECVEVTDEGIWEDFCDLFDYFPFAASISKKIFCIHGGISSSLQDIKDIKKISRPCEIPESGILSEILWADPSKEIKEFGKSDRGSGVFFGLNPVKRFLSNNGFEMMIRAHESNDLGINFPFYPDICVLTLFSAPNYCNYYQNNGAIVEINNKLECTYSIFKPISNQKEYEEEPCTLPKGKSI